LTSPEVRSAIVDILRFAAARIEQIGVHPEDEDDAAESEGDYTNAEGRFAMAMADYAEQVVAKAKARGALCSRCGSSDGAACICYAR
jgi:hypothetical protein